MSKNFTFQPVMMSGLYSTQNLVNVSTRPVSVTQLIYWTSSRSLTKLPMPKTIIFLVVWSFTVIQIRGWSAFSGLGKPFSLSHSMSIVRSLILFISQSILPLNSSAINGYWCLVLPKYSKLVTFLYWFTHFVA